MDIIETGHELMTLADNITAMAANMDDETADIIRTAAAAIKQITCQIIAAAYHGNNQEETR